LPDRPLGQHDKKYTVFKKGAVSHLNERVWSLEAMQNECENNRLTSYNLIKELLAFSRKDVFSPEHLNVKYFWDGQFGVQIPAFPVIMTEKH
jgi:hypothetical protein